MPTARKMHWTASEYTAMEAVSPIKHEFLDGEVFAMAGAKPDHNQVASAALVALGLLARGGRCRVFNSDQRIFVVETGLYTYADGGVGCGRWEIHADGMCLLNPTLLFEVRAYRSALGSFVNQPSSAPAATDQDVLRYVAGGSEDESRRMIYEGARGDSVSPSTRDYDRGAKLEHYRRIASLRHVLVIDQPERCVEHHHRADGGVWAVRTVREGALDLHDLGGSIALDEIYLPDAS